MIGLENYAGRIIFVPVMVLGVFVFAFSAGAQEQTAPKEKKEQIGYSIGVNVGRDMRDAGVEIDADMVARGVRDAYAGKPRLTEKEITTILGELDKEVQGKRKEKNRNTGEKNRGEGEAFLRENAKKKDVVTLPSGLQYQAIKEGSGRMPKPNDTVLVHYRGALIDGTEFDSSRVRNQPAEFVLGSNVIRGWFEVIQKMKVGSRWLVIVPSQLAYGEKGGGGLVGPNATLMFDIELLGVK